MIHGSMPRVSFRMAIQAVPWYSADLTFGHIHRSRKTDGTDGENGTVGENGENGEDHETKWFLGS